jgi:hypothetical protein
VADILAPLVGKTDHHLQNSQDLVAKLSGLVLEPDESLVSYDVTALFTSVPVQESVQIIQQQLEDDPTLAERTTMNPSQIAEMLSCCLNTTFFSYRGDLYQQSEGAAMGSPVSPIIANLFMEHFESKALSSFHTPVKLWVRYMDDTMAVLKTDSIDDFTTHINSQHPSIKFTIEKETEGRIAMLDTQIMRQPDGTLQFTVYRKPTHTDQYLQFDSHQPLEHKLSVVRTLTHRANSICSTESAREKEMKHLKEVLSISGYEKWVWNTPSTKKKTPTSQATEGTKKKGHITMPYASGTTEALARKIRQAGVSVHIKGSNSIRSKLVAPKDKTEKLNQSGVVYNIQCQDCDSNYVGETERALKMRMKEHRREASPVDAHMSSRRHSFREEDISILATDHRWFQRGVKEAIYINAASADLNLDRGRHHLPPIYNSLIKTHCSISNESSVGKK